MRSLLVMTLASLGLLAVPDLAGIGAVVVLAAAITLVALVVWALPGAAHRLPGHPSRAIDVSTLLSQSDPDAAGHPRPRAPQSAASAA